MTAMAKIYKKKLLEGAITFQDVPVRYKEDVKILLRADVANGIISPETYETITGEPYIPDNKEVNE